MRIKKILWLITIVLLSTSCNISNHNENAIDENVLDENATQFEILYEEVLEGQLKRLVQEKTEQPVFAFYDYIGSKEEDSYAYIFTGEMVEEFGDTMFQGALWYANGEDSVLLMDEIETSAFEPIIIEENNHLLLNVGSNLPGSAKSYIWAVNDHKPQLVFEASGSCFIDNGLLASVKSFISNSAGGRIWQRYYLYWDHNKQSYQYYDVKEITEEEFLSYENAQTARDEVETAIKEDIKQSLHRADLNVGSHFDYNYFKCGNGIIYVNYIITTDSDILYYYSI
ncbi:MAG: hypothetical protein K2K74_09530, partial [Lachnospiraceae bacterium]|nr:hypothetical protein [Lachnospiraceae bacterium]